MFLIFKLGSTQLSQTEKLDRVMGYPVDNNVVVSYHQASRITIGSTCGIKWLCDRVEWLQF